MTSDLTQAAYSELAKLAKRIESNVSAETPLDEILLDVQLVTARINATFCDPKDGPA